MQEIEDERGKRYRAEFQSYLEGEQKTRLRLDELSLAGAAGSLGISVTFIDKIAPHPVPGSRLVLLLAWGLILVSVAVGLFNLEFGAGGFARARHELTRAYRAKEDFDEAVPKSWNRWITRFNRASLTLLFLGVSCLVWFAYMNFPK